MKKEELVCEKCGGKNVDIQAWVNVNTNKYSGDTDDGLHDCYCNDCENEVRAIEESRYNNN